MRDNEQINFGEAEAFPVDVVDFGGAELPQKTAPEASVRNRAAMLTLLSSDPQEIVDNYQNMLLENQSGQTTYIDEVERGVIDNLKLRDFDVGLMEVMMDTSLSTEEKEQAINNFKTGDKGLTSAFIGESLIAESEGENVESSEARAYTGETLFRKIEDSVAQEQAFVNLAMKQFEEQSTIVGEAVGVAELFVPAEAGLKAASLINNLANKQGEDTPWSKLIKGFFRPGAAIEDLREEYSVLSPEDRMEFLKNVVEAVNETSTVVIPKSSQLQALASLQRIVGEYSPTEAAFDTAVNVIDILIPVSAFAYRGAKKAAKGSTEVGGTNPVNNKDVEDAVKNSNFSEKQAGDLALITKPSDPTEAVNAGRIRELEREHSELLENSQQLMEPGNIASIKEEIKGIDQQLRALESDVKQQIKQVQISQKLKYSEARKKVEAGISGAKTDLEMSKQRLTNMLENNADSAKSANRLKAIEDEIAVLKKDTTQVPLRKNAIIDGLERASLNGVVGNRIPASPGNILMATNPSKARTVLKAALNSSTDEVALAAFGVTRLEVLKDIALPKLTTDSGIVPAKPVDVTRDLGPQGVPENIVEAARRSTGDELSVNEIEKATENVKNDFLNATGVKVVGGMDGFRMDKDGAYLKISSVYGGSEGAFLYPEVAVEQLKRALRSYGVVAEDITVMMKDGVNYVPVDLNRVAGQKGEYYARVEVGHRVETLDLQGEVEKISVKRNWTDSMGITVSDTIGSLARHLLDASSMFDRKVMHGTMRSADKAASLGKTLARIASDFTDIYNKLPKARKRELDDYIFQANRDGIKFNPVALQNRFTPKELEALGHFRKFWDSHYYLENLDVVRSLRANKFGLMDNGTDRFFAKPVPKQFSNNRGYDPDTGTVRTLSPEELTALYDRGGSMAVLKNSEDIGGEVVSHIITDPTKNSYLRRIRDDDVALNYRDGYYQVNYKSNHFVYEKNPDGTELAVRAVAGSSKEAETLASRLASTDGKEYGVRGDDRMIPRDSIEYWQLNSSSGRIAQRHRGKPLVEAQGNNVMGTEQYIESPVDAAIRAANSIATRTSFRQVIDSIKERALKQYADVLPRNEYNQPRWPTTVSEIAKKGTTSSKLLRDARTTYEYVNFLERGYINHLDEAFKYAMLWTAEAAGSASTKAGGVISKSLEATEKATLAAVKSGVTPTNIGKSFVFFNYLVANMARQWIIQPAQAVRLLAYNPQGVTTGSVQKMFFQYFNDKYALGKNNPSDFTKFVDESGMIDAIDQSSLVRGTLMAASEKSNLYRRTVGRVTNTMRKGGYDLGETVNLLNHLAFVYDKFGRDGKNLADARVRSEAAHLAREISYGFNVAGDFPYTHNAAGIVTQFLQVPHKAILQYTNRSIPIEVRRRMFVGDMMIYGPPTALLYSLLGPDFLKDSPEIKDAAVNGLMHKTINSLATLLYGEKVDVAWSDSLSPYDFGGFSKVVEAVITDGGVVEMMANTPIGGLVMSDGSRLQKALLSSARYMGLSTDSALKPETLKDVASNIAGITSMWSNYQKGRLVLETQKLMNKQGQVIAENVNSFEAVAIMLGFPPSEVSNMYEASKKVKDARHKYEDDVRKAVKSVVEVATGKTKLDITNPETISVANELLLSVFKEDPQAMELVRKQMKFYYQDPRTGLEKGIMDNVIKPNLGTNLGEVIDAVQDPQKKEILRQLNRDADESLKRYKSNLDKEK